jgi:lipoprotein-anchoring transpeptidase ErfK/SrfK
MRDLVPARPPLFHGEALVGGVLDVAWVSADGAGVWSSPSAAARQKPKTVRARFDLVRVLEDAGTTVRVGDGEWMLVRDLSRPSVAPPPAEASRPGERWIDVDLATQTLVAYEGALPVYATLVSTGRGPKGTDSATPPGVHRIWVKLLASDMDNVTRDDTDAHYSLEDVPYVQFFDGAVALHGTYWHRDFGRMRSHGCVNLAPLDARWLFGFTAPRLPRGWVAAYPTSLDDGTLVRVH